MLRVQSALRMSSSRLAYSVAFAALALSLTGCSTFFGDKPKGAMGNLDMRSLEAAGYSVGANGLQVPVQLPEDGRPSVVLEVQDGKRHMERIPLNPEKPTFIDDIVKDAKLVERVGRIDVTILRPNGPNQPPVRMDVDFDSKGKQIMVDQNYSLRPGDHILVRRNSESFLDRMVMKSAPWMKR